MVGIVDSHPLECFPYYREAMCLQSFPPMCYVSGCGFAHDKRDNPYPICSDAYIHCMAQLFMYKCSYTVALSLSLTPGQLSSKSGDKSQYSCVSVSSYMYIVWCFQTILFFSCLVYQQELKFKLF